jgi:hypothetical protein
MNPWVWNSRIHKNHKNGIYNSDFKFWMDFTIAQYMGFGGGSMLRFTG